MYNERYAELVITDNLKIRLNKTKQSQGIQKVVCLTSNYFISAYIKRPF